RRSPEKEHFSGDRSWEGRASQSRCDMKGPHSRNECGWRMNRKERRAARKTGQAGGLSQSFSSQLRDMGDRHAQAGDIAQAESLYHQALTSNPNDIITLHRLGHLAILTGRIEEPSASLITAIVIQL